MTTSKKTVSDAEVLENLTIEEFDEIAFQKQVLMEGLPGALDLLPERQREVFVAHAVDGVSYARLAARFHETENNIRKQYSRAREALEGLLGAIDN